MLLLGALLSVCRVFDPIVLVGRQSHSCFANSGHKTAADISGELLKLEQIPVELLVRYMISLVYV